LDIDILTYLIFILSYLLIASRRLTLLPIGRPAGALLGAFLMVAGPPALVGLLINGALLWFFYRHRLPSQMTLLPIPLAVVDNRRQLRRVLPVTAGVMAGFNEVIE
jgi:hypothetical protein